MPLKRGSRLACFYCGKRASIRYDGQVRDFPCLNCDATNYLDKHGNTTDPPVAATSTVLATQYAMPLSSSVADPSESFASTSFSNSADASPSSASMFCAACLKNQALFTACLAQYDPEDDAEAEDDANSSSSGPAASFTSAALPATQRARPETVQRRYYDFRRRLERLYPQCCAACEPRVLARVEEARYTAKTDHLRRMMERSRADRTTRSVMAMSTLDRWAAAGRLVWWAGLAAQLLWHFASMADLRAEADRDWAVDGAGDLGWRVVARARALLPQDTGRLATVSVWMAMGGVWWNPEFTKVWRGFSRHILGLGQWYGLQGMIVAVRLMARTAIGGVSRAKGTKGPALPAAHMLAAGLMVFIYFLASKAIRLDTAPLFGASTTTSLKTTSPERKLSAPVRQGNEPKNLSDLLDEALESSPPGPRTVATPGRLPPSVPPLRSGHQYRSQTSPSVRLGGLSLADSQTPQRMAPARVATTPRRAGHDATDADEMDWSPVAAPPRALRNLSALSRPRPFTETPTQADPPGAFWYKVPPAPLAPAHRARNPPMAPRILAQPNESEEEGVSHTAIGKGGRRRGGWDEGRESDEGNAAGGAAGTMSLADPTFFAPEKGGDPANSLAEMLGASFSLGHDVINVEEEEQRQPASPAVRMLATRRAWLLEAAALVAMLCVWLHVTWTVVWYRSHAVLAALSFATTVAVWRGIDALCSPAGYPKQFFRIANIVLCIAEVVTAGFLAVREQRTLGEQQAMNLWSAGATWLGLPVDLFTGNDAVVGTGLFVGMALRRIVHVL